MILKRKWLIDAREEKGFNQKDFAISIGLSKSYLSSIENGERSPSGKTALKIARALDIPMEWFFEEPVEVESN